MNNSIVTIEDMTMAYHDAPVLWDVDIQIPAGSRTAIIGPIDDADALVTRIARAEVLLDAEQEGDAEEVAHELRIHIQS